MENSIKKYNILKNYINYKNVIIENMKGFNQSNPVDIFSKHKKRIFSQMGEDGIIEFIFSIVKPKHEYFVEFGAWDGEHLSNTANLRINKGWNGLLLEGDEEKVLSLPNKEKLNLRCELVSKNNINNIFLKYNVPKDFDFLSIDIDSNDYHVWAGLTKFRPTLVVVEINTGIKNELPLTIIENQSRVNIKTEFSNYFGANLHAFYNLATKKGYKLLTVEKWNAFFIINEEFDKFSIDTINKKEMLNKYCVFDKYWADRNKCPKNLLWKIAK